MKTTKNTRRENQSELLKKEILDAASEVSKEYGYEKAITKKIARKSRSIGRHNVQLLYKQT